MVNLTDLQITSKIVSAAGHVTLVSYVAAIITPNSYFQFCNFFDPHVRLHFVFMTAFVALAVIGHHDGRTPRSEAKILREKFSWRFSLSFFSLFFFFIKFFSLFFCKKILSIVKFFYIFLILLAVFRHHRVGPRFD